MAHFIRGGLMTDPEDQEAFPSMLPILSPGDFILEEGFVPQSDGTSPVRRLRLALSRGFGPVWDEERTSRRYPATMVATMLIWDSARERSSIENGDLVVEKEDTILHLGADAIDMWSRDPVPSRDADAVRVFRLIAVLRGSAKQMPSLVGIVYRKRYEIVQRLEEALAASPRERITSPDRLIASEAHILQELVREARHLGLADMEIVKRLAGVLGRPPV